MNGHRKVQLMLYEHLRDELTPHDRSVVESHLASCKSCKAKLEMMRSTLAQLPTPGGQASDARSDQFWNDFASSVVQKVNQKEAAKKNPVIDLVEWIEELFFLHPVYSYSAVGTVAAVLVVFAFWTFSPHEDRDVSAERTAPSVHQSTIETASTEGATVAIEVSPERMNKFFRKSKTLLVGLANLRADEGEPLDLSTERRVSRDLIHEARYLKHQPIDARSREVINDVDRILIELANIEANRNLLNVEIIRSGIHHENLLFKIRMAEAAYDSASFLYASDRR